MIPRLFGRLPGGEAVEAVTLTNAKGSSAEIITLGGTITALQMPDREGRLDDVVLGFDRLELYLEPRLCFGSIVGRIAGRVTAGRIRAGGCDYNLACNDGTNHLHGGTHGMDRRLWTFEKLSQREGDSSVSLFLASPDGEEGYPGTVEVTATYTLTADDRLIFETSVLVDQPTPISLTQHAYFNLSGTTAHGILDHSIQIAAKEYVPVDASLTLSDVRKPVAGTGADLNQPRKLRDALPGFYRNHGEHYLLESHGLHSGPIARVSEPSTGRVMEVHTTHTSLQFYTGYAIGGTAVGKRGQAYGPYSGLCLECEGYPNGSLVPELGDILVLPGLRQVRRTVYAFSSE